MPKHIVDIELMYRDEEEDNNLFLFATLDLLDREFTKIDMPQYISTEEGIVEQDTYCFNGSSYVYTLKNGDEYEFPVYDEFHEVDDETIGVIVEDMGIEFTEKDYRKKEWERILENLDGEDEDVIEEAKIKYGYTEF